MALQPSCSPWPPFKDCRDGGGFLRVGDEPGFRLSLGPPGRHRVRDPLGEISVRRLADVEVLSAWISRPRRDFSSISSTYHSATPCLTRRVNVLEAPRPASTMGSSAAISGMPSFSRVCSICVPRYVRRAMRSIDSQITTSNRRSGRGARRAGLDLPSRGIWMANCACVSRLGRRAPPDRSRRPRRAGRSRRRQPARPGTPGAAAAATASGPDGPQWTYGRRTRRGRRQPERRPALALPGGRSAQQRQPRVRLGRRRARAGQRSVMGVLRVRSVRDGWRAIRARRGAPRIAGGEGAVLPLRRCVVM